MHRAASDPGAIAAVAIPLRKAATRRSAQQLKMHFLEPRRIIAVDLANQAKSFDIQASPGLGVHEVIVSERDGRPGLWTRNPTVTG